MIVERQIHIYIDRQGMDGLTKGIYLRTLTGEMKKNQGVIDFLIGGQIDRWIYIEMDRQTDGQIKKQVDVQIDRWIDIEIDRQTNGQILKEMDRCIDRQIDRQIDSRLLDICIGLKMEYQVDLTIDR